MNTRLLPCIRLASLALALVAVPALAQNPPKKSPQNPPNVVKGTTQLAGGEGKFGVTYTIGERNPVNLTITSAEYSILPIHCDGHAVAPKRDEKLLILTYTIQNPNKTETNFTSGTLKFTGVDQENENHSTIGRIWRKGDVKSLAISLKPAQKIEVQTAMVVPGQGTVPKLMVEHQSGGPVLRYDLRPVLKTLAKPFSENGIDVIPELEGSKTELMPAGHHAIKFVSDGYQESPFGPHSTTKEKIFYLAKFSIKKLTPTGVHPVLQGQAVTEDGERIEDVGTRKASSHEYVSGPMELGQEMNVRLMFVVPKNAKIKEIRVWEDNTGLSRLYKFPVDAIYAAAQAPVAQTATPTQTATPATPATQTPAVTGLKADEYSTVFKDTKGADVMTVAHLESRSGEEKKTEFTVNGRKAILIEDKASNAVTLHFPDRNETLRAPMASGKDPQTNLQYFSLMYANTAVPKKKKNPLGGLGGQILGNVAREAGVSIINDSFYRGMGGVGTAQIVKNSALRTLHGYTVQEYTRKLGDAMLQTAQSDDPNAPERLQERAMNGKLVMTETTFTGSKAVAENTFNVPQQAKMVDATTMFKTFSEFLSAGLPKS